MLRMLKQEPKRFIINENKLFNNLSIDYFKILIVK